MLTYATRAVPWSRVGVAALLVLVMLDIVRRWPWHTWPLEGVAVVTLAAAAAWCFDEPAGEIVDVAPRQLAWRTIARLAGVAPLLLVWTAGVWAARSSLFGEAVVVWVQGLVAVVLGVAWTAARRAAGDPSPGLPFALAAVPVGTAWALIRPMEHALPVFPYAGGGPYGDWDASLWGWLGVGLVGTGWLVVVLAERPRSLSRW